MSESRSPEEIKADIEATREEVGDTVEDLAAKTDVKARVHDKVDELKAKAPAGTDEAAAAVKSNKVPVLAGVALLAAFLLGRRSGRPKY